MLHFPSCLAVAHACSLKKHRTPACLPRPYNSIFFGLHSPSDACFESLKGCHLENLCGDAIIRLIWYKLCLGKKKSFMLVGMVADHDVNIKKEVTPLLPS